MLPSLANLSIGCGPYDAGHEQMREESWLWLQACGKEHPPFKKWKSMRSKDKNAFHDIVQRLGPRYTTSYTNSNVKDLRSRLHQSIEHIFPRSKVNADRPGVTEDDVFGWASVDRDANSMRSNLPLVLWPTKGLPEGIVDIDGEAHYNPPNEHKARLARRWVYVRATYAFINVLASPSVAQQENADAIFKLIADTSPSPVELALHQELSKKYGGWRNPLMLQGEERDGFLKSKGFHMLVFQGPD
ncbi:hypothetical protein N9S30_00550 [bacterium]|nr:hypothetical protein [bacterium]